MRKNHPLRLYFSYFFLLIVLGGNFLFLMPAMAASPGLGLLPSEQNTGSADDSALYGAGPTLPDPWLAIGEMLAVMLLAAGAILGSGLVERIEKKVKTFSKHSPLL